MADAISLNSGLQDKLPVTQGLGLKIDLSAFAGRQIRPPSASQKTDCSFFPLQASQKSRHTDPIDTAPAAR